MSDDLFITHELAEDVLGFDQHLCDTLSKKSGYVTSSGVHATALLFIRKDLIKRLVEKSLNCPAECM